MRAESEQEPVEVKFLRNYRRPNERPYRRKAGYNFPRGTTGAFAFVPLSPFLASPLISGCCSLAEYLKETVEIFKKRIVVETVSTVSTNSGASKMDLTA